MEPLPNITEAIRKMSEAYVEALSTMTMAFGSIPKQRGEVGWVRNARAAGEAVLGRGAQSERVVVFEAEPAEAPF